MRQKASQIKQRVVCTLKLQFLMNFIIFQETVGLLEADIYNKVQGYYSKFIEAEMERVRNSNEIFSALGEKTTRTSRAANYQLFSVAYPSLSEHVM